MASSAMRGLSAFVKIYAGEQDWRRGDRALTLHMLRGLAPGFFAEHGLAREHEDALRALNLMPIDFPQRLSLDAAMSRVDGIYLRALEGQVESGLDRPQIEAYLAYSRSRHGWLSAWLMSEQLRRAGILEQPHTPPGAPFADDPTLRLYFLAHRFMVDSDYFARPLEAADYSAELQEMESSVEPLIAERGWDLLAEVAICLAACGRRPEAAWNALKIAQRRDGSWGEKGQDTRQAAHTTAACLIAVAMAETSTTR